MLLRNRRSSWRCHSCHDHRCHDRPHGAVDQVCGVKMAVDLDVDVVACDIVCVETLAPGYLGRGGSVEADFPFPDSFAAPSGEGSLVTRRTVACFHEQMLKVTMDVTYEVKVRKCTVIEVSSPVICCELPLRVTAN